MKGEEKLRIEGHEGCHIGIQSNEDYSGNKWKRILLSTRYLAINLSSRGGGGGGEGRYLSGPELEGAESVLPSGVAEASDLSVIDDEAS